MNIAVYAPKFLSPHATASGDITVLRNQLKGLARLGSEITVLTDTVKDFPKSDGQKDFLVSQMEAPIPLNLFEAAKIINKELDPDVIYTIGTPFFGVFSSFLDKLTEAPVVHYVDAIYYEHRLDKWWRGGIPEENKIPLKYKVKNFFRPPLQEILKREFLIKWGLNNVSRIITCSNYVKRSLDSLNLDLEKIEVIHPGLDLPRINYDTTCIDVDSPILTFFGHLHVFRGVLDLILAFSEIRKTYPKVKLVMAPSQIDSLTKYICDKLIERYNLSANIIWKGIVDDVYSELLAPSTIVVLPFRRLGMPLKLLESMAAAKPVITTRIEWTTEFISNGVTGYAVEVGDVDALACRIMMLLNNPEQAEMIGKRASKLIQEKCNLNNTSQQILNVFKKARYESAT